MNWAGKIIGGIFGLMVLGPLGMVFGILIGHYFDTGVRRSGGGFGAQFGFGSIARVQQIFFRATFTIMGHIAKADGRVSEQEIAMARQVMAQMRLSPQQKQQAIHYFNLGKQPEFNLDLQLRELRQACGAGSTLLRVFIEIQIQLAHVEGRASPIKNRILQQICAQLGFNMGAFHQFNTGYRAGQDYQRHTSQHRTAASLADAYRILGVNRNASDAEVKKAYRRLMSQHHPDKLAAKGLPEEMMKMATKKTQEIKAAHERIRQARGI